MAKGIFLTTVPATKYLLSVTVTQPAVASRRLAPGLRAKGSKIDYLCNLSQGTVGKVWLVTYNVLVDHILVDLSS